MSTKCPSCIVYIYDTLQHPLAPDHPHKEFFRFEKLQHQDWLTLASALHAMLQTYQGHHNLALRLLRETNAIQPLKPGDDAVLSIFQKILSWYKYMELGKKKGKHPLEREIDYVAVEAVSMGLVQTRQQENPLEVFKKWYLGLYFTLLENLNSLHTDHEKFDLSIGYTTIVVGDLDELYN